ncbi:DUF4328 domain-containing protein [Micromonospora sp. CPCC 205371]|nr:DUF4328 domain-containing protein [Micromonospora sp. CPCC 205371]
MPGYALRGVGLAAMIAVGAATAAAVLEGLWPLASAAIAREAAATEDAGLLDTAAAGDILVSLVAFFLLLVAATLVVVWLYRARRNLDKLGTAEGAMGPGWAIGGWFIPFANFVIPFRVTSAVARGSLPGSAWLTATLWGWWLSWVAATALERIVSSVDDRRYEALPAPAENASDFADYVAYHEGRFVLILPIAVLFAAAGLLLIMLIRDVSRGQEERLGAAPAEPIMPGMAVSAPPPT